MSVPRQQSGRKPVPAIAVGITLLLCGIAVKQELAKGTVDTSLLGVLVVLAFFWAGQSVDRIADRYLK